MKAIKLMARMKYIELSILLKYNIYYFNKLENISLKINVEKNFTKNK